MDLAPDKLASICQIAGPYEDARAKEIYAYADVIEEKCGQDFAKVFKRPLAEARKFLEEELGKPRVFADFLLLYGGGFPVFPVDARVARTAVRLGFGKMKPEKAGNERAYRAIQKVLEHEAPKNAEWLIRAHGLFCRLAMETCYASVPDCERCLLKAECVYVKKNPPQEKPEATAQKVYPRSRWSMARG